MKAVLWTAFGLVLAILWGREVLNFGAARRERENHRREELRFRRRTLGLFVLLLLAVLYEFADVFPYANPIHELAYYGVCFVLVIWLIIIAVRDVRDISETYVEERWQATLQTMIDVEERKGVADEKKAGAASNE